MRLKTITKQEEENIEEASLSLPKLPKKLKAELDRFTDRNCIVALENSYDAVCEQCLKAHALSEAKKLSLPQKIIESINKSFSCKTGHNGYYMDQDKIVKIKRG